MASPRGLAITMLVMVAASMILVLGNLPGTSAQCQDIIPGVIANCARFVLKVGPKIPPSKQCCDVLKGANIPCLCKHLTPPIKAVISIEKALYVAQTCGCTIPPGLQCGSDLLKV